MHAHQYSHTPFHKNKHTFITGSMACKVVKHLEALKESSQFNYVKSVSVYVCLRLHNALSLQLSLLSIHIKAELQNHTPIRLDTVSRYENS